MPSLCRTCDEDAEIFHGNGEEARFVELEDCKHTIEVGALIQWMTSAPESAEHNSGGNNPKIVDLKKCPDCKIIIRNTRSLNTFIQASLKDIEQVKLKVCGDPKENKMVQRILNEKLKVILDRGSYKTETVSLRPLYLSLYSETEFGRRPVAKPKQALIALMSKFELVEALKEICSSFDKRDKQRLQRTMHVVAIEKFEQRIRMAAEFMAYYRNSEQQRADISTEISFLQMMGNAIVKTCGRIFTLIEGKLVSEAFEVANKYGSGNESVRSEFTRLVNKALTRIGISVIENPIILKCISFQLGNWYKCCNGHIFSIADYGEEWVRNKCPECESVIIGDDNHALERDKSSGTENDGATASAIQMV